MTQDQTIKRALRILDRRMRNTSALSSPGSVRDYLRILLHDRGHEVFVVVFLDAQHRVIASEELFRGPLTQTSDTISTGKKAIMAKLFVMPTP
jgi:DNA repair protein RadC